MKKIIIGIEGMMCSGCENRVNQAVKNAYPVKKVSSSHSKNETVITTEVDIPEAQITAMLTGMGFKVVSFSVEEKRGLFSR